MGEMGQRFGSEWTMNASKIQDVFQLIECQRAGFRQYMASCIEAGIDFTIKRGEYFMEEKELDMTLGDNDLIITPVPAGADSAGQKILAAIAIAALVWWNPGNWAIAEGALTTWGQAALFVATNLAISGIQQLLMPGPETDRQQPDSYIFNGPVNNFQEGQPVPILYGQMIIGGAPINITTTTRKPSSEGYIYINGTSNSVVATPSGNK